MGKRIRIIWTLSLASALLLIGVQGYWLYKQYQNVVSAYAQELSEKILIAGDEEFRLRKLEIKTSYTYIMNKNVRISTDSLGKDFKGKSFSLFIANADENVPNADSLISEMTQKVIDSKDFKNRSRSPDEIILSDEPPVKGKYIGILGISDNYFGQDSNNSLTSFKLSINADVSDDDMHKGIEHAITNFRNPFRMELLDSVLITDVRGIDYTMKHLDIQDSTSVSSWRLSGNLFSPYINVVYLYSPFEFKSVVINAAIPLPPVYKSMAFQFLLSLFLILLLTGCFLLQIKTILKQKKINEMRGDFVNVMIHELKRPVQTLKTFISFLGNKDMRSDESITEQVIQDSMFELDNLSAYLKKLKDMIHADGDATSLKVIRFNLQELIDKIIRLVNHPPEKDVKISTNYDMESVWVEADAVHVANVLNNLIENAIKYSGEHVDIEIKVALKGKELCLTVSDNGIGIPYSEKDKVFAKFYRGSNIPDKNIPGIGLGLSYVKLITEAHKGKVSLLSDIGKGTSVTLCLPQSK